MELAYELLIDLLARLHYLNGPVCARRELNEVYTGGVGSYALMARFCA